MKHYLPAIRSLSAWAAIICSLASLPAFAGDKTGNGGDMCEDRIKVIRDDIATWITNGGANTLKFSQGVTLSQYTTKMRAAAAGTTVSCTGSTVSVGGIEKACRNFFDFSGRPQIICNSLRFAQTNASDQYVLVHHEYAGIAGLEVNNTDGSQYAVSNQISGYLVDQVVKKLAVKPRTDFLGGSHEGDQLAESQLPTGIIIKVTLDTIVQPYESRVLIGEDSNIFCEFVFVGNQSGRLSGELKLTTIEKYCHACGLDDSGSTDYDWRVVATLDGRPVRSQQDHEFQSAFQCRRQKTKSWDPTITLSEIKHALASKRGVVEIPLGEGF